MTTDNSGIPSMTTDNVQGGTISFNIENAGLGPVLADGMQGSQDLDGGISYQITVVDNSGNTNLTNFTSSMQDGVFNPDYLHWDTSTYDRAIVIKTQGGEDFSFQGITIINSAPDKQAQVHFQGFKDGVAVEGAVATFILNGGIPGGGEPFAATDYSAPYNTFTAADFSSAFQNVDEVRISNPNNDIWSPAEDMAPVVTVSFNDIVVGPAASDEPTEVFSLTGFDDKVFSESGLTAAPALLDGDLVLNLPSDFQINGAEVRIGGSMDGHYADTYSIRTEGMDAGQVALINNAIYYGGENIGTIIMPNQGQYGMPLAMQFYGSASETAIQAVLNNVTFQNTSDAPFETRTVPIQISSGGTGTNMPITFAKITITPENDAPTIFGDLTLTVEEGQSITLQINQDLGVSDPEDRPEDSVFHVDSVQGGTIKVDGITSTSFSWHDLASGRVSFERSFEDTGPAAITVRTTDDNGTTFSLPSVINVEVTPGNRPPAIEGDLKVTAPVGGSVTIKAEDLTAIDNDSPPEAIYYSVGNTFGGYVTLNGYFTWGFTQADLNAGRVAFKHDGYPTDNPRFEVSVSDDHNGLSQPIIVSVDVNQPPTLAGDGVIDWNGSNVLTVTTADLFVVDPDSPVDTVTYTVDWIYNGQIAVEGLPVTTFTHAEVAAGKVTFTVLDPQDWASPNFSVVATDATGGKSQSFSVSLIKPNHIPVVGGDMTLEVVSGQSVTITSADLNATDIDGDMLTYFVFSNSDGYVAVNGQQVPVFTQAQLDAGYVSFVSYTNSTQGSFFGLVQDGRGSSVPFTVNVNVTQPNQAPIIGGDGNVETVEGGLVAITLADLTGFDLDNGPSDLVYTVTAELAGKILVDAQEVDSFTQVDLIAGKVKFQHDGSPSSAFSGFQVNLTDGVNGTLPQTAFIHVNAAHVSKAPAAADQVVAINEDASYTFTAASFGFHDPNEGSSGDSFYGIIVATLPEGGTLTMNGNPVLAGQVITAGEIGSLVYSPAANQNGSNLGSFTFRVIDTGSTSNGGSNVSEQSYTFNFNVTPLSDAPVIGGLLSEPNISDKGTANPFEAVTVVDPDGADAILTATVTVDHPENGSFSALAGFVQNPDGSYSFVGTAEQVQQALRGLVFTPTENQVAPGLTATTGLTLKISDGELNATKTVSVTAYSTNDRPVSVDDGPVVVTEGGSVSVQAADGVLKNDFDADHDALEVSGVSFGGQHGAVGQAIEGVFGTLTLNSDGSYAYIANKAAADALRAGETVTESFSYTVNDINQMGLNAVPTGSTLTFEIHGTNDAAVIGGTSTGTVMEDGILTASGVLTVSDVDTGESGFLPQADVKGTYGTFSLDASTGAWTYTLDNTSSAVQALREGESRAETFKVKSTDGTAHDVTVTIGGAYDASVVDGVDVKTETVVNGDGTTSQIVTIPVVTPNRNETVGNNQYADIPIVTIDGRNLLTVQVGVGVGLTVSGSPAPKPAGSSLADLIREIQAHTAAGSTDQNQLTGGGSGFLGSLSTDTPLLVQTITPTSGSGISGTPLVIRGDATPGTPMTALVIDGSGLPSGSTIQLHDVEFAAVIGSVTVSGGNGSQHVWGDSASQTIFLGADDDTLHGGGGDDVVGSQGGNDWLYGDDGNDTVSGGIGDDHLFGGNGTDVLYGEDGNDAIDGGAGIDTMFGGNGNDVYIVDQASDAVIEAVSEGIDTVYSSANYILSANVENLILTDNAYFGYGNSSANAMYASDNGSLLHGWGGNDTLVGGAGRDALHGSSGNDKLYGGAGNDHLNGGAGKDRLEGGTGRDYLFGDSGNDLLKGGDGNDTINGGSGNDVIYGGKGKDVLYGSYGKDSFVFETKLGKSEIDTIKNFSVPYDTIRVENAIFTKIGGRGELKADAFQIGKQAADANDRIIYDADSGKLYYDRDGTGGAAKVQFAKLDKHLNLTHHDFLVI